MSLRKDYVFRNPKWKGKDKIQAPKQPKSTTPKRRPPEERMTVPKVKKALKKMLDGEGPAEDPVVADPGTPLTREEPPEAPGHATTSQRQDPPDPPSRTIDSPDQPPSNKSGDTRGMHLTPERAREIRKKRTYYPKLSPKIACDSCTFTAVCSYYKPGYECAFTPFLRQHKIESILDIKEAALAITEANGQRLQLSLILERLSGSINPETTGLSDVVMSHLERTKRMLEDAPEKEESSAGLEILKSLFDFSKSMAQPTTVNVAVVTNSSNTPSVAIEEKKPAAEEIATLRSGILDVQATIRDPVKNPDP